MGNTSSEIIFDSESENEFECIDYLDHTDQSIIIDQLKQIQKEYNNLFFIYKNIIKEVKEKVD